MNRLILIGNGFDLAHGLKVSYNDFIIDYLKKCLFTALENYRNGRNLDTENTRYEDLIVKIKIGRLSVYTNYINDPTKYYENKITEKTSLNELINLDTEIKISFSETYFSQRLFKNLIEYKWVDIENLYYENQLGWLKDYNDLRISKVATLLNVKKLNNQLNFIKEMLEKHLTEVQSKGIPHLDEIKKIINSNPQHLYKSNTLTPKHRETLVLNFNYTISADKYLNKDFGKIINIHGELNSQSNPIIFGYGDEVDKHYQEIEDLNENEFFRHIKSFDYFKTRNYSELLTFIESEEFEVFIMGHSCGLSDRTMLSTIFENKNCQSIKIYYNPNDLNDFRNKTYEISRHFNDKASMRRKIIPLPECSPMPQYTEQK